MRLNVGQLRRIATELECLAKISAIVKEIEIEGIICRLERKQATDERENDQYFLIGIVDSKDGKVMR